MTAPHHISLIKYGKAEVQGNDAVPTLRFLQRVAQDQQAQGCGNVTDPVLLELMQYACKEAALSQIDKEQILDAIVPPREWEEDGKRYRQLISKETPSRGQVSDLNHALNEQLTLRQARPDGICPIRRELADQCFDELIREVTITQAERGLLLLRVRDELRMTLSAYQDLFVSSRDYDSRKTVGKETMVQHQELSTKYCKLMKDVALIEKERNELSTTLEQKHQIYKEHRETARKKHQEDFHYLKRVNNALKQQIDAMIDNENSIDPIIAAYDHTKRKPIRKYWGPCDD